MKYICPMHPEVVSDKPGHCPKCGMNLVAENEISHKETNSINDSLGKTTWKSYLPLGVIAGLILLTSLVITYPDFQIRTIISTFMIGFFLVFSGFKLIDLGGFAQGYSTYDLVAKKWFGYGYIYPFIELLFGLVMILGFYAIQILWIEVIVMTFSGVGVLIKLLKHEKFQCVCLGTFLKVPLTKVTLVEDFGMAILALTLLITR